MVKRSGRLGNRRGQSIIEYLVVAAAIIIAIIALRPNIQGRMQDLGNASAAAVGTATTTLSGITAVAH